MIGLSSSRWNGQHQSPTASSPAIGRWIDSYLKRLRLIGAHSAFTSARVELIASPNRSDVLDEVWQRLDEFRSLGVRIATVLTTSTRRDSRPLAFRYAGAFGRSLMKDDIRVATFNRSGQLADQFHLTGYGIWTSEASSKASPATTQGRFAEAAAHAAFQMVWSLSVSPVDLLE